MPLAAQITPAPPPGPELAPTPAGQPLTPEAKLQKAFADVHEASQKLSKIDVPMTVEPAFSFKV
jgi:hypothetical protein